MERSSVQYGLKLITAAVAMVIVSTFYHEEVATLLFLSPAAEMRFVFLGLFLGGICGGLGIIVTVAGILRRATSGRDVSLAPTLLILAAAILLFFFLLYSSFKAPEPEKLRPGETLTI